MDIPVVIEADSFQSSWIKAVGHLKDNSWACHNLIVHISDILVFDPSVHKKISDFAGTNGLLGPKHVAYTIFPHGLYKGRGTAEQLYEKYNSPRGMFNWTRTRPRRGWGTYFRRMTHYGSNQPPVNQLANIVNAINRRGLDYAAAYTIVIQNPGPETVRTMGGPCLNYLAVQIQSGSPRKLGLLAVYRNHEFLERAYGNYWGLCNLSDFLSKETDSQPGPLTCVSSHAYVLKGRAILSQLLDSINEIT